MEFRVKGITYENEDGKDIQSIIKKEIRALKEQGLLNEEYEGYTNKEIKEMDLNVQQYSDVLFQVRVKEDIFENKPCVKIYIESENGNYIHVGYMPKKLLKDFNSYKIDVEDITGTAELIGGKYKHCKFYEEDYEEKVEVETIELDYGLLVQLDFKYNVQNKENARNEIIHKNDIIDATSKKNNIDDSKINTKIEYDIKKAKQKKNAKIGLLIYLLIFLGSFYMMPLGIIFMIISIIGFISCLASAF